MYAMNQNYNQSDPSSQVPPQILPHVHLVSSYRFPTLPTLQPAQALEYLIKGPQIVKDTSPVAWTYFPSPPPDGTVLLTWQPPRLQTQFASDGLVWADPEMAYDMQIRGYNLQVLIHKSGYHYPHEPLAQHARFRYRITHGPGHTDPNLWVVHYSISEPANRIPSGQIPIPREIHAIMQSRASLEAAGQLIRKEFMLADRQNWPKVEFTRGGAGQHPPYYNPMQPGRAYNQPPPNKRPRQSIPPQRAPGPAAMVQDTSLEEEENSTQDSFDFLTPREISKTRYKQHHEWMEEIFSSPHAVGKILPIDLGLGLMGELAPLTADILDAPTGEYPPTEASQTLFPEKNKGYTVKSYYKLQPEQLKDFETRVAEYTKTEEAELEKMRIAHTKRMADLKRSRTYIKAERRLRDVSRLESSRTHDSSDQEGADPLQGIVKELEESVGVTFDTKKNVVCIDKGGFIEEQQAPAQKAPEVNGNGTTQSNTDSGSNGLMDAIDVENTAASLLDQYGTTSLTGTPGGNLSVPPISQPQSQSQSAVATPSAPIGDPTQPTSLDEQANIEATSGENDLLDLDVEMSGMTNTDDKGAETDWVMVDEASGVQQPPSTDQPAVSSEAPADGAAATSGTEVDAATGIFDTADFGSFDNLDTAGDALADYANVDDNMGLDLVDDSAFGDAFHGTEMHHGETGDGDTA